MPQTSSASPHTRLPAAPGRPRPDGARRGPAAFAALASPSQPYVIAGFRAVLGLLFACHGAASLFGVLTGRHALAVSWPGWYAALIQFGCGLLVLVGLGTRAAAFLASGSMAYAYFTQHQPHALLPIQNTGEPAVLFCWGFLLLVFVGPGTLALDTLIRRSR